MLPGHLLAIQVSPIGRILVDQNCSAVPRHNLGMMTRDRSVIQMDIVVPQSADREFVADKFVGRRAVLGEINGQAHERAKLASAFAFGNQISELVEKVGCIMGPRRSLGMVLHAEDRHRFAAQALDRAVIEVDMGHFRIGRQ